MRSRLGMWAAALVESSWLAALLAVPIFYNVYSHETFEPDKIFLLRSLTALTLAATIVWCVDSGRAALTINGRPLWRLPLVKPVGALTAAYLLSTACSIAPQLSLWGLYLRAQGTYTWFSYVIIFLAIILLARERERWGRIVTVVLLASVPAALYAILQRFELDPIDWGLRPAPRTPGTAGNPIFLGAYLIMVMPLTLARLLAVRREHKALLRAAPYVLLLTLQAVALFYTESRGPTVGCAFGLAAFAILAALLRGVRWPLVACAALAALVAVAVAPRLAAGPGKPVERLGQLLTWQEGSGRVRVLIWRGVTEVLRRNPARAVIGHGPETLLLALAPEYPAEMATYERPSVAPDRAHNEVLDALATTGALGCLAELVLFGAFFFHTLRWLGVSTTSARRNWFVAATVGGALCGGTAAVVLGSSEFVGLGLSLGLAGGILAYLTVLVTRRLERVANLRDADAMLLAALFAGIFAHFVELQTGIGTSTTRTYFFAFAALAVAIGSHASTPAFRDQRTDSTVLPPSVAGVIVGLLLSLLSIDFYTPTVHLERYAVPLAVVFVLTWAFGGVLVAEESLGARARGLELGTYAATSCTLWLLFGGIFVPWVETTRQLTARPTPAIVLGAQLAGGMSLIYAVVFACVGVLAAALVERRRGVPAKSIRWQGTAAVVAVALPATVAVLGNLRWSRADCFAKLGTSYEQQGAWSSATIAHERALQLAPSTQAYAANLSRALITHARAVAARDPARRDADAQRAIQLIEQSARANPLHPDDPSNLARLYRKWARIGDPTSRAQRFERAEAAYKQALELWPNNVVLWNELALLYLERGEPQKMWETFDYSLRLNDHFFETYVYRAQVFLTLQRPDDATADYRRARRCAGSREELARLYADTGQVDRALAEAQAGLADAGPEERRYLQGLIRLLEAERRQPAAGS